MLLIASARVSVEDIRDTNKIASEVFPSVTSIRASIANEGKWPQAPNDMFKAGYNWVKLNRRPYFLWMEPDCAPMCQFWLDILEDAYRASGKTFMGFVFDKPFRHMNGVAIWNAMFPRFNPQILGANNLPFDCIRPELNIRRCHATSLIWRQLADPARNQSLTFPTIESLSVIPKETVLTHCCKDQTIIDRLMERNLKIKTESALEISNEDRFLQSWFKRSVQSIKSTGKKLINKRPSVDVLYICVHGPSEPEVPRDFNACHRRFAETYLKYKPEIPHRVLIVNYNGERTPETDKIFKPLKPEHTYYVGTGFDIGTYQAIGKTLDTDLVMFCGSQIHFHRSGWLERIVEAYQKYGDGIYGPMGSYERMPHLRTCCVAMPPKLMRQYPYYINSRADTYRAESGDWNLTRWVVSQGKPALMVTWDKELEVNDWRKPDNIFRRGNQSNCIVWDRHTKVYAEATPEYREELERSARGGMPSGGVHHFDVFIKNSITPSKSVTIAAFTSLAPRSHAEAIRRTAACIPFECKKLLMSPVHLPNFDGEQLRLPEPWAKNGRWRMEDMAMFTLTGLHRFINTDAVIIVHWDGYGLNSNRWTNDFLQWDYIGAPWAKHMRFLRRPDGRVGNGGFSLRSKKWLETAAKLPKLPPEYSEDIYAAHLHTKHFEKSGCKFAPLDVAMRWSFEYHIEEFPAWQLSDSFGFHGLTNIPERAHLKLDPNH